MPGGVTFAADVDETVEIVDGKGRVRIGADGDWTACQGGQRFHIAARTRFEVDAQEPVHYVTHMGRNGAAPGA
jgi:uncharacterized protein YaiE (UPF0345 family)